MSGLKEQGRAIKENARKIGKASLVVSGVGAGLAAEHYFHSPGLQIGSGALGAVTGALTDRIMSGGRNADNNSARNFARGLAIAIEGAGAGTMMDVGAPDEVLIFTTSMFGGSIVDATLGIVRDKGTVFRKKKDKNNE